MSIDISLSTADAFLLVMWVIFTVPYLAWRLLRTDYFAPLVVVQIVIGILLGPAIAGRLFPGLHDAIFTGPVLQFLGGIAAWGVAVFVWCAGIELDVRQAWANRRECVITAGFALAVPLLFGMVVTGVLASGTRWIGPEASGWQFVTGVGMACAVSALPVLIMLLEKLSILRAPIGQRLLRYASLDDIVIWIVLALILMDVHRIGLQVAFVAAFGICSLGYRRLMPRLDAADRWYVGVIWMLLSAFAAEWFGLHFMIGAFLAGAVTDAEWFEERRRTEIRFGVLLLLMPVYFLVTGLRTDWGVDSAAVMLVAAALLAVAVLGKLLGVWIAGRILRWPAGDASLVGWMLQTKGLIMIVFTSVLLDKRLISQETFTALLMMAVVSTILTVPMASRKLKGIPKWH